VSGRRCIRVLDGSASDWQCADLWNAEAKRGAESAEPMAGIAGAMVQPSRGPYGTYWFNTRAREDGTLEEIN
jgi:hypothetical protein